MGFNHFHTRPVSERYKFLLHASCSQVELAAEDNRERLPQNRPGAELHACETEHMGECIHVYTHIFNIYTYTHTYRQDFKKISTSTRTTLALLHQVQTNRITDTALPYVLVPWCFCAVTLVGYQGTVLKWEGPSPYLVLTYVKWVMGDVSVMQVYWYLGVFVLSPW